MAPDADPLPEEDIKIKDSMQEEPEYHNHIYWKVPIKDDDDLLNELLEDYDWKAERIIYKNFVT